MASFLRRAASLGVPALRRGFSAAAKTTTGITGLPVVPNAREVLISLYTKTIRTARAFDDVFYNQHVIKLSQHRMDIVKGNEDISAIEKLIGMGQVEQLIVQAEDELDLVVVMNEDFRIWEADPEADADMAMWAGESWNGAGMPVPSAEDFASVGVGVADAPVKVGAAAK